ncbi:heavy-metal-associated domain-containing protein [Microbacterium sp.]|uniref:heavy-metal-associated domain-containing protein n=1 Tax=Microbacterium sp. TaxID=51671 RepID=UPI0039E4086F
MHEYRIQGMTCAHCAAAVTREVGRIAGVSDISVDVSTGILSLAGDAPEAAIAAAVDEAGYTLVAAR